jgi:hypothetical protein
MFIALMLTLCTMSSTGQQCNAYYIDAFAGDFVEGQLSPVEKVSLSDQWSDCLDSMDVETELARSAARSDLATNPSANNGKYTLNREAYLKRFNIVEAVNSIEVWEYSCAKVKGEDTP